MPEYLAPRVYVEEVDTGSKPIEGVSTSTAGVIGVAERGPVNVPMLITSAGEYARWFGGRLRREDFTDAVSGAHYFLPPAVDGFFTNGGKRVYVTRVLDTDAAARATFTLHDRGAASPARSMLLGAVRTVGATTIYLANTNAAFPGTSALPAGFARLRIGDGSSSEYRDRDNVANGAPTHVPLDRPFARAHATTTGADEIPRTPVALGGGSLTVLPEARAGATTITVEGTVAAAITAIAVNQIVEIGAQFNAELRYITAVTNIDAQHARLTLDAPLQSTAAVSTVVTPLESLDSAAPVASAANRQLETDLAPGDRVAFLANRTAAEFTTHGNLIVLNNAAPVSREVRRIGSLAMLGIAAPPDAPYPAGSTVSAVTVADDVAPTAAKRLTAAAVAGSRVILLNDRQTLAPGVVLRVGTAPDHEFVTVGAAPPPGVAPNAGNVVLAVQLRLAHANGADVHVQTAPALRNDRPTGSAALGVEDPSQLVTTDGGDAATVYAAGDVLRVTTPSGEVAYHVVASRVALTAEPIPLTAPLALSHPAGSTVVTRGPLLRLEALDAGAWGNRLRVQVNDEPAGIVSRTTLADFNLGNPIRLGSFAGVEPGTVLELVDQQGQPLAGGLLKVDAVDRATGNITLAQALTPAQIAAASALPAGQFLGVRSREFRLTVHLLRQPDPAQPSRNNQVIDVEMFPNLSMDPRHSRYVLRVVGAFNGTLRRSDRRPEGESWYVRGEDQGNAVAQASIRLGPELLIDALPDGRTRPARQALAGGDDSLITLDDDDDYVGHDAINPEQRTGLQSLRNVEEISIVACPGRTTTNIQQALIDHCELMRFRFAVLDGPRPNADTIPDVQALRQRYDTKYAAVYHPWLLTDDPFPLNAAAPSDYAIPPSGHVVGIFARTDVERGVHKAPANEVVRGVLGLARVINDEQHDILNPYPVNINVIRDFRAQNRGIRVYGGRVITSDSDWKYVNVRRLLIFIESSINRGLNWVVFEPNAEPLWARVRRSISNFLTLVWRNGGLEGTKVEEAYFVKCDRTTMTQTDIDSGRLICLVGVAPVKPAEFVIVRIGLWTSRTDE